MRLTTKQVIVTEKEMAFNADQGGLSLGQRIDNHLAAMAKDGAYLTYLEINLEPGDWKHYLEAAKEGCIAEWPEPYTEAVRKRQGR